MSECVCVALLRPPYVFAYKTDGFSWWTGLLTRSAADAAIAYAAIEAAANGSTVFSPAANGDTVAPASLQPATLQSVKLGVPTSFFYDDLEPQVAAAIDGVLARLENEGAELIPIDLSEELASVVPLRVRLPAACLLVHEVHINAVPGLSLLPSPLPLPTPLSLPLSSACFLGAGSNSPSRIHAVFWGRRHVAATDVGESPPSHGQQCAPECPWVGGNCRGLLDREAQGG